MRKIVFITILAFASTAVVAQTEYKFQKGNLATELQLSLFSTKAQLHYEEDDEDEWVNYSAAGPISMPGLRLRYALNDNLVLRATFELDMGHASHKQTFNNDTSYHHDYFYEMRVSNGKSTNKSRYTQFAIRPGIEYHFGNWERMSVYVGGEAVFGIRTTQSNNNADITANAYERDWYGDWEFSYQIQTVSSFKAKNSVQDWRSNYHQNGVMFFGINAVIGMDFYVYKGLYLGAELGLGYVHTTALKGSVNGTSKIKWTDEDGDADFIENKVDIKLEDKINGGNLSFRCNPMIRFGWKF